MGIPWDEFTADDLEPLPDVLPDEDLHQVPVLAAALLRTAVEDAEEPVGKVEKRLRRKINVGLEGFQRSDQWREWVNYSPMVEWCCDVLQQDVGAMRRALLREDGE